MILNVWTVTALFLAGVGGGLALVVLGVAARELAARAGRPASDRASSEDRLHLVVLVIGVLTAVRLLAWPHFYLLLRSYVTDLAPFGAMCAFGVTQVRPEWVQALQWLKPTLFAALGFWWLLEIADRNVARPAFARWRWGLAVPLALLALAESGAEIGYVLIEKVGTPVTCCTQFLETAAATPTRGLVPLARFGVDAPGWILAAYALSHLLVIAGCLALARRRGPARVAVMGVLAVAGAANLLVTQWTWLQVVAPRVLQLPYHRCVYELLTDAP
ncbi:MAG TPA: hypothetical protein VKU85_12480, partial [bacterium]|nr:hypothetical protein [bacterium]